MYPTLWTVNVSQLNTTQLVGSKLHVTLPHNSVDECKKSTDFCTTLMMYPVQNIFAHKGKGGAFNTVYCARSILSAENNYISAIWRISESTDLI